jgi:hypothetical protein
MLLKNSTKEVQMARNPIAKALRLPHLKAKVVKSKKLYSRKEKHTKLTKGRIDCALWRFWSGVFGVCAFLGFGFFV